MAVHAPATRPILLTRPRAASERLALELAGADVFIAPLMEIVGTKNGVTLDGYLGVIFTSANAIPFVPCAPIPAYCVGPKTADAALAAGFDAVQVGQDAESLIEGLLGSNPKGPLVHPHGRHVRGSVAETLTAQGIQTDGVVVYDQKSHPPNDVFRNAISQDGIIVPLFSPRSAALFAQAVEKLPKNAALIALSARVASMLPTEWADQIEILPRPDPDLMAAALDSAKMRRISP